MSDPGKRLICLGAFAGAHGVRGDVKIRTFTEAEENIAAYGPLTTEDGKRAFTLKVARLLKPGLMLARAAEISTREEAEAVAGLRLHIARERLPPASEGEFYIEDLIGLSAFDLTGAPLGRLVAVHDFGAGEFLELFADEKDPLYIPFSNAAVPSIDLTGGRIVIDKSYVAEFSGDPSDIGSDEN